VGGDRPEGRPPVSPPDPINPKFPLEFFRFDQYQIRNFLQAPAAKAATVLISISAKKSVSPMSTGIGRTDCNRVIVFRFLRPLVHGSITSDRGIVPDLLCEVHHPGYARDTAVDLPGSLLPGKYRDRTGGLASRAEACGFLDIEVDENPVRGDHLLSVARRSVIATEIFPDPCPSVCGEPSRYARGGGFPGRILRRHDLERRDLRHSIDPSGCHSLHCSRQGLSAFKLNGRPKTDR